MEIIENKVVSLIYELRQDSAKGDVVENVDKDKPLTFLFGTGNLLPKFEENLAGLKIGDSFEFGLNSEDAYGPVIDNAIVEVPKNVFEVEGKIDENMVQVGNMVPMMDNEGRRLNGLIVEIKGEAVKMDFNHPMAGEDLYFKGEVIDVREATEEEMSHGHTHDNHESCGTCDDHSNGEDSCSSCNC